MHWWKRGRQTEKYRSLKDFIERLTGTVNKRAIENFIKAGALDCLEGNRRQKMIVYSQIVDSIASGEEEFFCRTDESV